MKIVITAGGTSEAIDKVRKITNMSKGTLGRALVEVAMDHKKISEIYFISPFSTTMKKDMGKFKGKVVWIQTDSAKSVHDTLHDLLTKEKIDAVIHAMAVSDYTVDHLFSLEDMVNELCNHIRTNKEALNEDCLRKWFKEGSFRLDNSSKVSSKSNDLYIKLTPTEKIISYIKKWSPETKLVGFKLLENVTKEHLISVAKEQMVKNNTQFVFANDIQLIRKNGHQGYLINEAGDEMLLVGLDQISQVIIQKVVGDDHV